MRTVVLIRTGVLMRTRLLMRIGVFICCVNGDSSVHEDRSVD